jgi:adenine-specific DNA glycosylase
VSTILQKVLGHASLEMTRRMRISQRMTYRTSTSALAYCRCGLVRDFPQPADVAQAADLERVGEMFLGLGLYRRPSP